MSKYKYDLGDAFAVPLKSGGYAIGVISRMTMKSHGAKTIFGHFFGPKLMVAPNLTELHGLKPEKYLFKCLFGDLGLNEGRWPVIGQVDSWNKDD